MNDIKMLFNNLTKIQKVGLLCVLQILIIIVIASIVNFVFSGREYVGIANDNGILKQVPNDILNNFKSVLWETIKENHDVSRSVVDDIVIREDTYKEIVENNSKSINFIVDIDSIKQTYEISIGWNTNSKGNDTSGVNVGCPPISKMKYKETFCRGMFNNTNSFDLYFPHFLYGEADGEEKECGVGERCDIDGTDEEASYQHDVGLLYHIDGDEENKIITIESSACNVEKYNQKALEYLRDYTPFYNNSEYIIKYEINATDVTCGQE